MLEDYKYSPEMFVWNNQFKYDPSDFIKYDNLADEMREFYRIFEEVKAGNKNYDGLLLGQYQDIYYTLKNIALDNAIDGQLYNELIDYFGGMADEKL